MSVYVFVCMCVHVSEASLSLTAPLCQSLSQRLSVNVSFCSVVYSDVAAVSLLNEIKATSTVFQHVVLWIFPPHININITPYTLIQGSFICHFTTQGSIV